MTYTLIASHFSLGGEDINQPALSNVVFIQYLRKSQTSLAAMTYFGKEECDSE